MLLIDFLSSSTQKGVNLKSIYYIIANESGLTRAEIAVKAELNLSTCSRLIDELLEKGFLYECGEAASSGGRKARKYAISPELKYIVGIDISRTYTKVLLLRLDFHPVEESRFDMTETSTPEATIQMIIRAIYSMIKSQNIQQDSLLGIGISAIGPLDTEEGVIINPRHFPAPGWSNIPIVNRLTEEFQTQVVLDYGENTALTAEYYLGVAKKEHTTIHINKGIGIRLGLMVHGKILRSETNVGAFGQGHMIVDIHGRKCACGNYGCMSAYSTIPALTKEVQQRLKRGSPSILRNKISDFSALTFDDIVYAIEQQDPLCKEVVMDSAYYSAAGLANLIAIFQPSRMILSGPMYRRLDLFYKVSIEQAKERYYKLFPNLNVQFSQGELGENAAAIGSGRIVFDSFFNGNV